MAYPQLTGRTAPPAAHTTGRAVFITVLALVILAVAGWRLIPHEAAAAPQTPAADGATP